MRIVREIAKKLIHSNIRTFEHPNISHRGFTLVEMLVVIGIIVVLVGASVVGYSRMIKTAEKARAQELVANVATALTALFQENGVWPKALAADGSTDGILDERAARPLVKYMSLTLKDGKLAGHDRYGILTPWGMAVMKRKGTSAALSDRIGKATLGDHRLHYALDLDGDGVIKGADVGGESVDIRATAAVWSIGKDGGNGGKPWPYKTGIRKGDVYSWAKGQTVDVK